MARESSGFSKGDLDNALGVRDATKQIGQFLKAIGADTNNFSRDFATVSREANNFATYQANAVKSTKNVNKLLEKANNLRGLANKQQAEASRYFTRAQKAEKQAYDLTLKGTKEAKQKAKVLKAQAKEQEDIAKALDAQVGNSTALADQFETLGKTSQDLSRNVYGTAAAISDTLGLSNHLTTSFEDANEIQRQKQIIQEDELELQGKINAAFEDYLKMNHENVEDQKEINRLQKEFVEEGKGMTADRLSQFDLEGITGGGENDVAAERIKSAQKGMSNTKTALPSELGTMMKGLGKAIGALAKSLIVLKGIAKVVEFIEYSIFGVENEAVDLARAFSISKREGHELRKSIDASAQAAGLLGANTEDFIKLQLEFTKQTGMVTRLNTDQLKTMSLMTKQLGFSNEEAVHLTESFKAQGTSSEQGLESLIEGYNTMKLQGKATATFKALMGDITSDAELQRTFLTQGADAAMRQAQAVRRTGLSLSQQRSTAEGLLDFEKTMSDQLELQIFTGKDINLLDAQRLAAAGDTQGAFKLIQKEMGKLSAAEMKMPMIRNKMLSVLGMSYEQYLETLNVQQQQNAALLKEQKIVKALAAETGKLHLAKTKIFNDEESFRKTLNEQQQKDFDIALEKYKNDQRYISDINVAKLSGISEEKAQTKVLNDMINEFSEAQIQNARARAGYVDTEIKDFTNLRTTSEAFEDTMRMVKSQFASLVNTDVINKLTTSLVDFMKRVAEVGLVSALFGGGTAEVADKETAALLNNKDLSVADKKLVEELERIRNSEDNTGVQANRIKLREDKQAAAAELGRLTAIYNDPETKRNRLEEQAKAAAGSDQGDFILRPGQPPISFNKGDLIMGGTQLGMGGGKVERLLEELLAETKAGKVIKMDTVTVAQSLKRNAIKMNS